MTLVECRQHPQQTRCHTGARRRRVARHRSHPLSAQWNLSVPVPSAASVACTPMTTPIGTDPDSAATSQQEISAEIATIESGYQRAGVQETQPRLGYAPYRSSLLRHPTKDLHHADPEGVELWTPCFSERDVHPLESDLTIQHRGEPIGERMVVTGRVVDGDGRPVRRQLVEIW